MRQIKEIKELSKEDKLQILNEILKKYPESNSGLCFAIVRTALSKGYITDYQYCCHDFLTDIAISLIPELRQFARASKLDSWFDGGAERFYAVKKMINQINNRHYID